MNTYNFEIINRKLKVADTVLLRQGSINADKLIFELDTEWNQFDTNVPVGYTGVLLAIFTTAAGAYQISLGNRECMIPADVYENPEVTIGVVGKLIINDTVTTSIVSSPLSFIIRDGSVEGDDPGNLPSPSQWDTYLATITGILTEAGAIEDNIEQIQSDLLNLQAELTAQVNDIQQQLDNGDFNGESAYEIAVDEGFIGTEEEWIASLHATYTLPVATNQTLGGIKAGTNLTIEADGTANVEIDNSIELKSNKVAIIDENSTDEEYPSAKCVYDIIGDIADALGQI